MKDQYTTLSQLFSYPQEGYKENVEACMHYLNNHYPDAASSLKRFHDFVVGKTLFEIEEVYGITFHIQAICYLDIGYVLFGEDYSRGEFLLNMKKEQAKINHDCGEELADNLPHVLQLMAISEEDDFIQELAVKAVIPAVEKMLEEFRASRMELKQKIIKKKQKAVIMEDVVDGNIYQNAIQALLKVLHADFKDSQYDQPKPSLATPIGLAASSCGGGCSFINKTDKTVKT